MPFGMTSVRARGLLALMRRLDRRARADDEARVRRDPAPRGLQHPVHQAEAVRVVARHVRAVRRDDVRQPREALGEPGDDAVGIDEVNVAEAVIAAAGHADDPPGREQHVRDHLDERAGRQPQSHAGNARHVHAADEVVRRQAAIGHRHDVDAMPSIGEAPGDAHDDLGSAATQRGKLIRRFEYLHRRLLCSRTAVRSSANREQ